MSPAWLAGKLPLTQKAHFIDTRRRIRFQELSAEEKNALIREAALTGLRGKEAAFAKTHERIAQIVANS